jgi:GntR family transcriptional regulator/MocR family aminotransferase
MSLARRLALLDAADNADAWIIEDDFDGEFCFGGHRLPSLKSVDHAGRVFYVGTFSKTLFPALRLGYFLAPPAMVDVFQAAVSAFAPSVPSNTQAVVSDFIEEGHYANHIRRMRRVYRARYESLIASARSYLPGLLEVKPVEAGLHTVGMLDARLDEAEVSARAAERGITVTPIRRFCMENVESNGVLMGFSGFDVAAIEAGVKTLSEVLGELARRPRRAAR